MSDLLTPITRPDLPDALEALQPIQETAGWSESYLSQAYFPEAGIGLWLRLVRLPDAPEVWGEVMVVTLPDGRFLVARGFGYGGGAGPSASGLSFQCREPWRTWEMTFHGAARLVGPEELEAGPMPDGHHEPVDFVMAFEAMTPVFAEGLGEQFWAAGHYEQYCTVSGRIAFCGEVHELAGTGLRDHSHGPRDLSAVSTHVWTTGQFESGRTLMFMDVHSKAGHRLAHAVAGDRHGFHDAEVSDYPLIRDASCAWDVADIMFDGEPLRIRPVAIAPLSIIGRNEWVVGVHPDRAYTLHETMVELTHRGETGWGYMERSSP